MNYASRPNSDTTPLEERYAGLNINDAPVELDYVDDEEVAAHENNEGNPQFCIISRVLTDRNVVLPSFQDAMGNTIRPMEGMVLKELGNNVFAFKFFDELDYERVLADAPWNFMQSPIVMWPLLPGQNPRQVELTQLNIWVQIHGLVGGLRSEKGIRDIGNAIGIFVSVDSKKS
nr:uncharacterized protein LOC108948005 [Nicotiana tomentosiformis]